MYPGAYLDSFPDKPAAVMAGTESVVTYRQLEDRSTRFARVLFSAGLRRGDHIALLSDNDLKVFEVYWAAMRSGLYLTTVNRHLSPSEISYIVNDCGAKALVVAGSLKDSAAKIVGDTPNVSLRYSYNGPVEGHASYEEALAGASSVPLPSQPRGIDMLYSSGTTGRPKGIKPELPNRQVDETGDTMTEMNARVWGVGPDTVYLSPAPLYHSAPLRTCASVQALGGTVVVMDRFDAEQALQYIERYRITYSQWVPTMFVRMLKLPEEVRRKHDLSSLRSAVHAAAPCPIDIKRRMIEWWGPILSEYYSSTELNGLTLADSDEWLRKPGTVGRAILGIPHVCDDTGVELSAGQIGTLYFERDSMPFEYHNAPEKTRDAQHPTYPTWSTTGDVGYLDEDGYLFLTDRKSFMIISGGVNIYPQEIENALIEHPSVLDAAVIGVPDEEMGESVKAVVQTSPNAIPSPDLAKELQEFLRARIASYKVPRTVDFTHALPRTPSGKLVKGKLREAYRPS